MMQFDEFLQEVRKTLKKPSSAVFVMLLRVVTVWWSGDRQVNVEVGGKRVCKDRAPQPGGRFVSSVRACAQMSNSVLCRLPFPFVPRGISLSLQDWPV